MRRFLKLAALLGSVGALVWSMRDRIRIAVKKAETPDPDYRIVDPEPSEAQPASPQEAPEQTPSEKAEEDSDSETEGDSENPG